MILKKKKNRVKTKVTYKYKTEIVLRMKELKDIKINYTHNSKKKNQ